jgi:hypothetical protein
MADRAERILDKLMRSVRLLCAAVLGGATVAALMFAGTPLLAQDGAVALTLFRGESGTSSNLRLSSWGSGKAEETKDNILNGDVAIRVTTHGLYQGARLDFKNAVDLSAALKNPHTYLRLMVRFSGQDAQQSSFDPSSLQSSQKAASPFERMRFLLIMGDGSQHEMIRPVDLPPSEDVDAYVALNFPMATVLKTFGGKIPTGEGAKLKSLVISGDQYQQFHIGEIRLLTDETEINVSPLDDMIAFPNSELSFSGAAEGGASTLKFSWDFDSSDGIQQDAVGRTVNYTFRKAGKYTVTLTVSDVDGLKKPQSVTLDLDVAQ